MLRLRGKSYGAGMALGSACVMRAPNGIPLLPARLVAQMARARYDTRIEPVEVILVARDYESAASLALPWAQIVGIAAEYAAADSVRIGVPTVVGIEGLMEKVEEDALLLIDGDRSIVLVDPDGMALAAYQAERERITPRRRFYLDFAHQTAQTLDGRTVRVLACVETLDEMRVAQENGADAFYLPPETVLLPADEPDEEQFERLYTLAEAAAGKPVTIRGDARSLSASALLRAAVRAEFTLAVPLAYGTDGFRELQHYLQETREELLAAESEFADFRLAGAAVLEEPLEEELADFLIGRVIIETEGGGTLDSPTSRAWLEGVATAAGALLVPVEVILDTADALETVLGLGAAGVIVSPDAIQEIKERVRKLDTSLCRAQTTDHRPTTTDH